MIGSVELSNRFVSRDCVLLDLLLLLHIIIAIADKIRKTTETTTMIIIK